MSVGEPRPLTNEELWDFEQSERCRRSWHSQSLLLTIQAIREEHFYEMEVIKSQRAEVKQRLNWFENTYSVRAMEPLRRPHPMNGECPHCHKLGEFGIGDSRSCFNCGMTWSRQAITTASPLDGPQSAACATERPSRELQ